MNEQKHIPGREGRNLFLNRYLNCFVQDTEELVHSVLGGAYRNMAGAENEKNQEYLQFVVDAAEKLTSLISEIRDGLCRDETEKTEENMTTDIDELFQELINELQRVYEGEKCYVWTEIAVEHIKIEEEQGKMLRLLTDMIISFIDYNGTEGAVFLKIEEIACRGHRAEFCFKIKKERGSWECTGGLADDREKERLFYLGMEKICCWLQEHDGSLETEEDGYRLIFRCNVRNEGCPVQKSGLYSMEDAKKEKGSAEITDLISLRKKYVRLVGKRILLAVYGRCDMPLAELLELVGIRTVAVYDAAAALQQMWWNEKERFSGIVICAGKSNKEGIELAECIRSIEWGNLQRIPVIMLEEMEMGKEAGGISFERILEMLCEGECEV